MAKQEKGFWHPFDLKTVLGNLAKDVKKVLSNQEKIMSAISDFADKMKAHNDKVDAAVAGLQGDVKNLNDQIAALQASQGQISAADQALLDAIEAKAGDVAAKLDALDALTPPAAPPSP